MTIEKAQHSDLNEILSIQKKAFIQEAEINNDFNIPPLKETFENIEDELERKIILVCRENNRVIGSVRAQIINNICCIGRLCVSPEFQNKGVGSALMKAIENQVKAERYELFTGEKSLKNITLYKKLGYQIFKTEKQSDKVNLVFMKKVSAK